MTMIHIYENNKWVRKTPTLQTIFVIRPGAGTARNRRAYQVLEKNANVIYIADSGGTFDKYPDVWENNAFVESSGNHLGGIAEIIEKKYTKKILSLIVL